jgi:hypothetical protein
MPTRLLVQSAQPFFWNLPHEVRRYIYRRYRAQALDYFQHLRIKLAVGEDHSLKPFDLHKCIFVHIPKCAGISVSTSLFGNLAGGHTPIRIYSLVFNKKEFDAYFKFTFVRNPWDRVASAYFYLRDGPGLRAISESPPLLEQMKRVVSVYSDFDSFVREWINRENIRKLHLFAPQCDYLCLNGRQSAMDFVGYFENLVEDFHYVTRRIGVEAELLHLNRVRPSAESYLAAYSDDTRRIVSDVYREDIEFLGYTFDNSSLNQQLTRRRQHLSVVDRPDRDWPNGDTVRTAPA